MIDIHQHLLPSELREGLARAGRLPELDAHAHDPAARAAGAATEGLGLVGLALPGALGLDALPEHEARPLLELWHASALALGAPFAVWAGVPLAACDPADVDAALDRGCLGLQLPASALADGAGADRVGRLLEACARRGAPVLVHPGPAPWERTRRTAHGPAWWGAVVPPVQALQAAWWCVRACVRPALPDLRICFTGLAGLAPLHDERYAAATGGRTPVDRNAFLETSYYGTRGVDAVIRVLGIDVLVHGTGSPARPPAPLALGGAVDHALRSSNPARLLDRVEVAA